MHSFFSPNISRSLLFGVIIALVDPVSSDTGACDVLEDMVKKSRTLLSGHISECFATADRDTLLRLVTLGLQFRNESVSTEILSANDLERDNPDLIHLAALMEQPRVVGLLLRRNPSLLNARDGRGRTPLTAAAIGRAYMSSEILLKAGASVDVGESMVIAAGRARAIAYLIAEYDTSWAEQPAIAARVLAAGSEYMDEPFVQFLLALGLSPNLEDKNGHKVILAAAHHKNTSVGQNIWKLLAANGADTISAICSIDSATIAHIRDNAPDWFVREIDVVLPECDARMPPPNDNS